jgi:LAGLIDADG-like domain
MSSSPATVFLHLKKLGLKLRDPIEASIKALTKFQRMAFAGDKSERAYLLGFVYGDCSVDRHGRAVRVRSGTTHLEFVNLFRRLFGKYGRIRTYPKRSKLIPAEWNLEVDLHGTFEFLHEKNRQPIPDIISDGKFMMAFVAGFSDAEGTIYIHRKKFGQAFGFVISNTNSPILKRIQELLLAEGYHPALYQMINRARPPLGSKDSVIWRLGVFRARDVVRLLTALPLRHKEKLDRAKLALSYHKSEPTLDSKGSPEGWLDCLRQISEERNSFIREAVAALDEKSKKS